MAAKPLITGLLVAVVLLGAAALLKLAQHSGVVDAGMAASSWQALIGLMVAFYGNFIPKNLGPIRSAEAERRRQPVLRLSGWAFTLAGLAYAGLAFLKPRETADTAAMFVMASAVLVTLVATLGCFVSRSRTP